MKKQLFSLIAALILVGSLFGCSSDTATVDVSVTELADSLAEYVRMPMPVDDTMATEVYHLNLEEIEEYAILETGMMPGPGTAIIVKAKADKVDAVKSSVEKILEDKVGAAFYPAEQDAANAAEVRVDGNIVSLLILNEEIQEEAVAAYEAALK